MLLSFGNNMADTFRFFSSIFHFSSFFFFFSFSFSSSGQASAIFNKIFMRQERAASLAKVQSIFLLGYTLHRLNFLRKRKQKRSETVGSPNRFVSPSKVK